MAGNLQVHNQYTFVTLKKSKSRVCDIFIEGRQTFMDQLDQLSHATQGRFQYEFPPDPRDRWKDELGRQHAPPQPRPGMGPVPPGLQLDLTASSGSVLRTFLFSSLYASSVTSEIGILTQHTEGLVHKVSQHRGGCICSRLEIQVSKEV